MSAKQAAMLGAATGGAWGGLLAAALAEYLSGDTHFLPLFLGSLVGASIAGLFTAVVTPKTLSEPTIEPAEEHHHNLPTN